jgi:hypothetical protein
MHMLSTGIHLRKLWPLLNLGDFQLFAGDFQEGFRLPFSL